MKRFLNRIIVALIIISILTTAIPSVSAAETDDNHLLYGRKQLVLLDNGENLVKAYDRIIAGIESRATEVSLSDLNMNRDQLITVVTTTRNDAHGHFWLASSYSYTSYTDGRIVAFKPRYNELGSCSEEDFKKNVSAFNNAISAITRKAGIKKGMSQYDIELRLHNALVQELEYVIDAPNAHSAYGALVEKKAVCQGYTLAFNYLLRLNGIEAHYVTGYSKGVSHAWTLVNIDGLYYYTDLTWDDPNGTHSGCNEIFHSYFNVTKNILSLDHIFDELPYPLPACDSIEASYYQHNPERIIGANPDVNLIASFFTNGSASVYVPDEYVESFKAWYRENIRELATLAGFDMTQGVSYLYTYSKNEYHLIIEGTLIKPEEPEVTVERGDTDGDGNITSMDSNLLKRIIAGNMQATETNLVGGDLDEDEKLSSMDSNLLKRLLAGN